MKIRAKLQIAFAITIVTIITVFGLVIGVLNSKKSDAVVINLAGRQRMLSQKMSKEVFDYASSLKLSNGNSSEELDKKLTQIQKTCKLFDLTLKALSNSGKAPLSLDPQGPQTELPASTGAIKLQLEKVNALWGPFYSTIKELQKSPASKQQLATIWSGNIPLLKNMNKAVGMMQKLSEKKDRSLLQIVGAGLFFLLLVFLANTYITFFIIRNLDDFSLKMDVIKKGDLTQKFKVPGSCELGIFAMNTNQFIENIRQLVEEVNSDVQAISSASEELSVTTELIVNNSSMAAENTQTVAAAMEEISASVIEISQHSDQAALLSNETSHQAATSTKLISELQTSSQSVSKVIEVINSIAEKIDLLALNATIEAASAGEAGRGFAVVATEVKELAARTGSATQEIFEQIQMMQKNVEKSTEATLSISKSIDEINEKNQSIALIVTQQSEAANEVSNVSGKSASAAMETKASSDEIATCSNELARMAGELKVMISKFKTE